LAARAIAEYVESEEETLAKIRDGLAQADAGETVSHKQALRFVNAPEKPIPAPEEVSVRWTRAALDGVAVFAYISRDKA
jgi:hypothetical protein